MEIIKRDDVFGSVLAGGVNGATTMDSREIAELTEKQHTHVCRDIRRQLEVQEIDQSIYGSIFLDSYGREQVCFKLDYEQTMILVSGYSILLRAKIVKRWKELENQLKPALPQSYSEALRQLATTVEYNERLQLENKQKEETITKQLPKVEFFDAVTGSDDILEMGEVAKILTTGEHGRNQLFAFLRDKGVLMKNNQPYQKYVDAGYFKVIESPWYNPNGDVQINLKTVVYQKGVDYIRKLLAK